jgi:hypothetical protein
MKREELSALKKALKIPGMQSHINRKAAAWGVIHRKAGFTSRRKYKPSNEIVYEWAKGKIASILYSSLHQKSLEELYEMYACGMTAGEMNFLDEVNIIDEAKKQSGLKIIGIRPSKKPHCMWYEADRQPLWSNLRINSKGKSQSVIDEAKKQGGLKIIGVRPSKKPLGDLTGLPKRKATK